MTYSRCGKAVEGNVSHFDICPKLQSHLASSYIPKIPFKEENLDSFKTYNISLKNFEAPIFC
jgi:hypothetical protein